MARQRTSHSILDSLQMIVEMSLEHGDQLSLYVEVTHTVLLKRAGRADEAFILLQCSRSISRNGKHQKLGHLGEGE